MPGRALRVPNPVSVSVSALASAGRTTYSLAELQAGTPPGVDPAHKENFLSDDDFLSVFGMDKVAFDKLQPWKRDEKKREKRIS